MHIRDPVRGKFGSGWFRDPGWKKFGSGIRDKHPGSATLGVIYRNVEYGNYWCWCVQAVAAALEHMEATASALFVSKILKEETALKLEAGTKRIQAPPCFRDYFNQCCEQCSGSADPCL
jgi:hypothetical protein